MELQLNPGETVIMTQTDIKYGKGPGAQKNELTLTNQSLILTKKSFFGKVKDVTRYPLEDVVITGGQAQVRVSKPDIVSAALDVYFKTGRERFGFTWEDDVKDWANAINTLLTGQSDLYKKSDWMEGISDMADSLYNVSKKVRKTFGIKSTEKVSGTCSACGASLTGTAGESVRCPYCGTFTTLE